MPVLEPGDAMAARPASPTRGEIGATSVSAGGITHQPRRPGARGAAIWSSKGRRVEAIAAAFCGSSRDIDLDEGSGRRPLLSMAAAAAAAEDGRSIEWIASDWGDGIGRLVRLEATDEVKPDRVTLAPGISSSLPWTRFSPKSRWPAAGRGDGVGLVVWTAIRVTLSVRRPARVAAPPFPFLTGGEPVRCVRVALAYRKGAMPRRQPPAATLAGSRRADGRSLFATSPACRTGSGSSFAITGWRRPGKAEALFERVMRAARRRGHLITRRPAADGYRATQRERTAQPRTPDAATARPGPRPSGDYGPPSGPARSNSSSRRSTGRPATRGQGRSAPSSSPLWRARPGSPSWRSAGWTTVGARRRRRVSGGRDRQRSTRGQRRSGVKRKAVPTPDGLAVARSSLAETFQAVAERPGGQAHRRSRRSRAMVKAPPTSSE